MTARTGNPVLDRQAGFGSVSFVDIIGAHSQKLERRSKKSGEMPENKKAKDPLNPQFRKFVRKTIRINLIQLTGD
jgi:hypothetical protein